MVRKSNIIIIETKMITIVSFIEVEFKCAEKVQKSTPTQLDTILQKFIFLKKENKWKMCYTRIITKKWSLSASQKRSVFPELELAAGCFGNILEITIYVTFLWWQGISLSYPDATFFPQCPASMCLYLPWLVFACQFYLLTHPGVFCSFCFSESWSWLLAQHFQ